MLHEKVFLLCTSGSFVLSQYLAQSLNVKDCPFHECARVCNVWYLQWRMFCGFRCNGSDTWHPVPDNDACAVNTFREFLWMWHGSIYTGSDWTKRGIKAWFIWKNPEWPTNTGWGLNMRQSQLNLLPLSLSEQNATKECYEFSCCL